MANLNSIRRTVLVGYHKNISYTTKRSIVSNANLFKEHTKSQSTVDQGEVNLHTEQLDHWWDPNGLMKALHALNLLRVPFVRDGLVPSTATERQLKPLQGKKILDVGCGGGILSEPLARLGAEVTGVDASPELIELAQQHCNKDDSLRNNKPTYYCSAVEDHAPKYLNNYDAVVASEIIEHVTNKELFIKSCVDTLKPGGRIFITTPTRSRLTQVFGIFMAEYVLKILPKGTHQYEKLTTPNEVTFLLERNNCHVEAVYGMMYMVHVNRWKWANSHVFMFALQAQKLE